MNLDSDKFSWLHSEDVKPFVFVREDMRVQNPGSLFSSEKFSKEPIWFNPLHMDQVSYANQILNLESRAFKSSGLVMPRWVFYDCAIMPGFVAGFAHKTESLPLEYQVALGGKSDRIWTPISLFIIIPTMIPGEWFAHNLSSVNSLLARENRLYGLGFLTKAFGLWYANIQTCCGATQWGSTAVKLHTQYGAFQFVTAYTPAHDYPKTITYRLKVDPKYWQSFLSKEPLHFFDQSYEPAGFQVDPSNDEDLMALQRRIENHEGPFYLSPNEVREKPPGANLDIYVEKS